MSDPTGLPVLGQEPRERRDAARNRALLLETARRLVRDRGPDSVTMDAVAEAAGVGKGTVFRRFGSREGLMASLLDHREAEWQAAVISGPPPLGPGAEPMDRLLAFGRSRIRLHLEQGALIEAAGRTWGENYAVVGFATMHVRLQLQQLGVRGNLPYLATALIAPLSLPFLRQQVEHLGMTEEQVHHAWTELVHRVVG